MDIFKTIGKVYLGLFGTKKPLWAEIHYLVGSLSPETST